MPFLRERSGRWSAVKVAAFIASLLPAMWVALQGATGDLGARPITEAIHQIGEWTLRLLLITLAITPAQRILRYPRLVLARRTLGIATAVYAGLHISLYVLDQHFDLLKVASEIVLRIYLLIGALALSGLIVLAVTSSDAAVSRLGAQRWKLLHRCVYVIALLASVHFFMQSKLNIYEPVLMAGFLIWLLAFRLLLWRSGALTLPHLVLLAAASATATAVVEATVYFLSSGVDARRLLLAHFDFDMEVRPAWWVLAAGLAVAGLATWHDTPAAVRARGRRPPLGAIGGVTQVQPGS